MKNVQQKGTPVFVQRLGDPYRKGDADNEIGEIGVDDDVGPAPGKPSSVAGMSSDAA